ncbi:MAG: NYN domain-containing protein [Clostridia bacterium]|nr:NYN domain-containing protein [Clostridia bacterium]
MDLLIVDGYNIIHAWQDIFPLDKNTLEECRIKLAELLSNYQGYSGYEIVIVFDAYKVMDGVGSLKKYDNLKIVYTRERQTADNFIERFVSEVRGIGNIIVATGDGLEQKTILLKGGLRLTAKELKHDIMLASKKQNRQKYMKSDKNRLEDHLSKDQIELFEKMRRGNE